MVKMPEFSILYAKGIEVAPRIIGHQDRNELSPTYGYFGRRYWAWKTAAMPDASNQYAFYYLALLWDLDEKANPYFRNENLFGWIVAGIERWMALQNKDGSFDQVFPNEHSVGATSYTLLAVLETNKIIGGLLQGQMRERMRASIERAGTFLLKNDETYGVISNHLALFAVTFHELWRLTGKQEYQDKCKIQIRIILDNMSSEGWFREYEGADPGYMTQCLYYLARLLEEGYSELKEPVDIAIKEYLPYFIHPDGSIGGHYGSRNTSIFYPGGVALLASKYSEAKEILSCMCKGIIKGNTLCPSSLDFPNSFRLACNYLVAWSCLKRTRNAILRENNAYQLPWQIRSVWKEFPEAGVLIVGTSSYYAILGVKKGGIFKIFAKGNEKLMFYDMGYIAKMEGRSIATQVFNDSTCLRKYEKKKEVSLIHPFFTIKLQHMYPVKYIFLLLFGFTIFRWKYFRELFKQLMVRKLITNKRPTAVKYERKIIFSEKTVVIQDMVIPLNGNVLSNLCGGSDHATIHMASSDYFDFSSPQNSRNVSVPLVNSKGVIIEYTLNLSDDECDSVNSVRIQISDIE